jgi:glutaminyl-peptide cyclotransferase
MPFALALALIACAASAQNASRDNFLRYEIVATHPHDARAFTQGLAFLEGDLLEGTGQYGASTLSRRTVAGKVLRERVLDRKHFGEGVAIAGTRIVQLTWQSGIAFVYDPQLNKTGELRYSGEGWGLAFDGAHWLMSDGSDRIAFRKVDDFSVVREIRVTDRGRPVRQLNELEFVDGKLYANVWHSDRIAVVDPASGRVEGWLDLAPLRKGFAKPPAWSEAEHVLNGIAFNPVNGHFYVTGKCWPVVYELRLLPP